MKTQIQDPIDLDTLKRLYAQADGRCLTFYIPTQESTAETLKNPTRLKHLLSEAANRLETDGMRTAEVDELLEPLRELLNDFDFWQCQSQGLALFRDSQQLEVLRLGHSVQEHLHIGPRFYLKPLISELGGHDRFFLLKLSQNHVALYRGDRNSLEQVEVPDLPNDIDEALWYDDPERSVQHHTNQSPIKSRQAPAGGPSAQFHGQGVNKDSKKNELLRFFREIDDALKSVLNDAKVPLLLAAVEYYHPIYREANSYAHLADDIIPGNPEHLSDGELHEAAYDKIVAPREEKHRQEVIERIREGVAKDIGSDSVEDVATSAREGRVAACIVSQQAHVPGKYDEEKFCYERVSGQPAAPELTEVAAVETILHGGEAITLKSEEIPFESPVAAVYRY